MARNALLTRSARPESSETPPITEPEFVPAGAEPVPDHLPTVEELQALIHAMARRGHQERRLGPEPSQTLSGMEGRPEPFQAAPGTDYRQPQTAPSPNALITQLPRAEATAQTPEREAAATEDLRQLSYPDIGYQTASPATMDQARELRDSTSAAAGLTMAGVSALGAPETLMAQAGARGLRAAGNVAARYPLTTTAAAGTTALTAAPSQAEPPSESQRARDLVQTDRETITRYEREQKAYRDAASRFDKLSASSPRQSIIDAQSAVGVTPDGIWKDKTAAAIQAYRNQQNTLADAYNAKLVTARRDLERHDLDVTNREAADRERAAEPGLARGIVREWGPWIGALAGAYLGHRSRTGAVRAAEAETARTVGGSNALLTRTPINPADPESPLGPAPMPTGRTIAAANERARRVGNINEFWRSGGAGENVPFRPTQTQRGFAARPNAAESATLYPPDERALRGRDYGVMGASLGEAGLSGGGAVAARYELAAAQDAYNKDRSEVNLNRLERARDIVAAADLFWRGGVGVFAGRLGGAWTHPYSNARPDVAGAEAERIMINQLLARRRK